MIKTISDLVRERIHELIAEHTANEVLFLRDIKGYVPVPCTFTADQFRDIKGASILLARMANSRQGEEYNELTCVGMSEHTFKEGKYFKVYEFLRDPIPQRRRTGGKKRTAKPRKIDIMNRVDVVAEAWHEAVPNWFPVPVGNGDTTHHSENGKEQRGRYRE